VRILPLDVTSAESVAACKELKDQPIDLSSTTPASRRSRRRPKLEDLKIEEFENVLRVNTPAGRVTQALLPNLRAQGQVIVGITSTLAASPQSPRGFYGYRESKAALDMFIRSAAAEFRKDNFICVASPRLGETDMAPDAS